MVRALRQRDGDRCCGMIQRSHFTQSIATSRTNPAIIAPQHNAGVAEW